MAEIQLGGKRGVGRGTQVSDSRFEVLNSLEWRVKKFQSGYEQIIQSGQGGWRYPLARLIMEQIVARPLAANEHVHHKDDDTFNNRDENLELLEKGRHIAEHNRRNRSYARAEQAATKKRRANPDCGAYHNGHNRWAASYLGTYLGMFETRKEALACYRKALEEGIDAARVVRRDPDDENRGVYLQKSGRWRAQFCSKSLGTYDTKEEAIAIYREAVSEGPDALPAKRAALITKPRGIYQTASGRWIASFRGKSLGRYKTEAEALTAYRTAKEAHQCP